MPDRTRNIELYQNEGALISVGPTQVIRFTNFDASTSDTVKFDDSAPNKGEWNAGDSATIGADAATLLGTGLSYAGVKVTLLGIPLADIRLGTPVRTALLDLDGTQMLHFYNVDGSEAGPAVLLDPLASQLVATLTSTLIPFALRPLVDAILANPLRYVQNNALLTMNLQVGCEVLSLDNGFRPIRWIGRRKLSAGQLQLSPQLRPIRIEAGALGNGLPLRRLEVSPQHRCLIRPMIAKRSVGVRKVLAAARHLLLVDSVSVVEDDAPVTYFHMLLDSHELPLSNGAATESLFIGPMAMQLTSADDRLEIMSLFPDLCTEEATHVMPPARKLRVGRIAKAILACANKNTRPVVERRLCTPH